MAASGQYFALIPHMFSPPLAPLVGGLLLSDAGLGRSAGRVPASRFLDAVTAAGPRALRRDHAPRGRRREDDEGQRPGRPRSARPAASASWQRGRRQGPSTSSIGPVFSKEIYDRIARLPPGVPEGPWRVRIVRAVRARRGSRWPSCRSSPWPCCSSSRSWPDGCSTPGLRNSTVWVEHLVLAATFIAGGRDLAREKAHRAGHGDVPAQVPEGAGGGPRGRARFGPDPGLRPELAVLHLDRLRPRPTGSASSRNGSWSLVMAAGFLAMSVRFVGALDGRRRGWARPSRRRPWGSSSASSPSSQLLAAGEAPSRAGARGGPGVPAARAHRGGRADDRPARRRGPAGIADLHRAGRHRLPALRQGGPAARDHPQPGLQRPHGQRHPGHPALRGRSASSCPRARRASGWSASSRPCSAGSRAD
ncbi:MAG: hypothetical protein MZU84_06235 [Sphingobacterium sp.]|nr:hypothetical protein [Sphingobacterium sp.]